MKLDECSINSNIARNTCVELIMIKIALIPKRIINIILNAICIQCNIEVIMKYNPYIL